MNYGIFPKTRLRRLRQLTAIRELIQETELQADKWILPLFIRHGSNIKNPILALPGHFQLSVDQLAQEIEVLSLLGIKGVILFGIPAKKDATGTDAYDENGIIQTAIPVIKQTNPD